MNIPAANIVMTFDPEAMIRFQEERSFTGFKSWAEAQEAKDREAASADKKKYKPQTYLFNNIPGSNFLSLSHQYGTGGSKEAPVIRIELVDPQGLFEDAMMAGTMASNEPATANPYYTILASKQAEIHAEQRAITALRYTLNKENQEPPFGEGMITRDGIYRGLRRAKHDPTFTYMATINGRDITLDEEMFDRARELLGEKSARSRKLRALIKDLKEMEASGMSHKLTFINNQMAENVPLTQRPVYITYGVGDNLLDWSPPTCFGEITTLEYKFDGKGARILTLLFAGQAVHPNLTRMGINPLGDSKKGFLTKGMSNPFFNDESYDSQLKALTQLKAQKDVPDFRYIGKPNRPSFHLLITNTIRNYIRSGTDYDNVVVILPNLDAGGQGSGYGGGNLQGYFRETWKRVSPQISNTSLQKVIDKCTTAGKLPGKAISTVSDMKRVECYKQVLESIGFSVAEMRMFSGMGTPTMVGTPAAGAIPHIPYEEAATPEEALEWFTNRRMYAVLQNDYVSQSFREKLEAVASSLSKIIRDYNKGFRELKVGFHIETDYNMLNIMYKHQLIDNKMVPAIIWGDNNMIKQFLQARLMEADIAQLASELHAESPDSNRKAEQIRETTMKLQTGRIEREKVVKTIITDVLHPIDVLRGLNYNYMKDVVDYLRPPIWNSPFGPSYGDLEDSEMLSNSTTMREGVEHLRKDQPHAASRLPIFSLGTKNSNILSIDIDINQIYTKWMKTAGPVPATDQQKVDAFFGNPPSQMRNKAAKMFSAMSKFDHTKVDEETGVPKDFETLVEKWYVDEWRSDGVTGFNQWSTFFSEARTELGLGEEFSDMAGKEFKNWFDSSNKIEFYKYMWSAFKALYDKTAGTKGFNRSQITIGGKEPTDAGITAVANITKKLGENVLKGKITTLPQFNLANDIRVLNRPCLVFCAEPRFTLGGGLKEKVFTWYSGLYQLNGFKHTISKGNVQSQFFIMRRSGPYDEEDNEAGSE
tara:strand:+ start:9924 stop:12887 length:2964 start_codon:yes stop_codon:yes gene_type:complete